MLKIYAVETDRAQRHEAARRILKWKYEEIWQSPMPEIQIGERGKLYFPDAEKQFCFSYCDGLAFCAISDSNVGLDAEKIRSVSAAAISRLLSRDEWLQYARSSNPMEVFMRFWTLKEAYFKFTGQGITGASLKELSFDLSGDCPVLADAQNLYFWCRVIGDVALSVCTDCVQRPELYALDLS